MADGKHCTVIGAGATGSNLAWLLARLVMEKMSLYDGDVVARHNLANQVFSLNDVGKFKVVALVDALQKSLGITVEAVPEFVREYRRLMPVVFMCIDSMEDSKRIMEQSIFGQKNIAVVFQSRMDATRCVTYAFDPNNPVHIEMWQHYWFPDSEAQNETLACSGIRSVCYTPLIAASLMAESYSVWLESREGESKPPPQMRWLDLKMHTMEAEYWDA